MGKLSIQSILLWIILATTAAGGEARPADAVDVFRCAFADEWDINYDRWPDRWVRHTGATYPHYVSIEIADEPTTIDGKCLRIDLDGASAAVSTPPIRVTSRFSYILTARLNNQGLKRSAVVLWLDFYDTEGKLLWSEKSPPIASTNGWQPIGMGPVEPNDPAVDHAVVRLEVIRGGKGDLQGRVLLDDVRLGRLPRISVTTNNPFNVYSSPSDVQVKCTLSGIREREPEIHFQLLQGDQLLDTGTVRLDGRRISDDAGDGSNTADGTETAPDSFEGSAEWRPRITEYGYYRVVIRMHSSGPAAETEGLEQDRTVWLAVVPPLAMPARGEFGWSLPNSDNSLSLDQLSRLLPQLGIHWVKLPVWFDAGNPRRGDELIRFVELLGASNIEVVGIIDKPPPGTELAGRFGPESTVADVLAPDPAVWSAALEPVMTRLSLRVRRWQLGADYDTGFSGYADLNKRIAALRTNLFRFGQDVKVGLCRDWETEDQATGDVAWEFQQYCRSDRPTRHEFDALLLRPRENSAERWVLVEPPGQDAPDRFREFILMLVSAKEHGADAIIVPSPFNDENGLMRAGGMPGELLLPWRTTAAMLGGAKFVGRMQLPGGSENRVFARPDGSIIMVVWNDVPTREILYLGKDVQRIDMLGRAGPCNEEEGAQLLDVEAVPAFITGLHPAITRWNISLDFEQRQVPSVFSRPHANVLMFHNSFDQGVGGSVTIVVPQLERDGGFDETIDAPETAGTTDRWTIDPAQATFRLAAGEVARLPFEIRLRNAMYGKQPIRVDFKVEADEPCQFSVYREMEVGTGALSLRVQTYLDDDGSLVVKQVMTNQSDTLPDFKCYLYGGPRRQRMQVYRLGADEDTKVYRFPNGRALLGKQMMLEIEELNGERVLRHGFVVTDSPDNEADAAVQEPTESAARHAEEAAGSNAGDA